MNEYAMAIRRVDIPENSLDFEVTCEYPGDILNAWFVMSKPKIKAEGAHGDVHVILALNVHPEGAMITRRYSVVPPDAVIGTEMYHMTPVGAYLHQNGSIVGIYERHRIQ